MDFRTEAQYTIELGTGRVLVIHELLRDQCQTQVLFKGRLTTVHGTLPLPDLALLAGVAELHNRGGFLLAMRVRGGSMLAQHDVPTNAITLGVASAGDAARIGSTLLQVAPLARDPSVFKASHLGSHGYMHDLMDPETRTHPRHFRSRLLGVLKALEVMAELNLFTPPPH